MYTDPSGYKIEDEGDRVKFTGNEMIWLLARLGFDVSGLRGNINESNSSAIGGIQTHGGGVLKNVHWIFGLTLQFLRYGTYNQHNCSSTGFFTFFTYTSTIEANPLTALMDSWLQGPRSGKPPIASSADRGQGEGSSWFPFGIRNKSSEVIWILENWGDSWQPLKPNDPWFKPFDAVKAHGVIIKVNDVQTYGPFRINIIVVDKVNSMDSGFRYNVLAMSLNQLLNFFYGLFFNKTKETFIPKNTPGWE